VHNVLPTGVIVMWGGAVNAIPAGWALCNGSNGTPDLRDRFIVGAGTTYAVGANAGATTQTLTTSNLPGHTHTYSTYGTGTSGAAGGHTHTATSTVTDAGHNHTVSDGGHTHTTSVTDPGHYHESQYDNRTPGSIDYIGSGSEIGGSGYQWQFPTTSSTTGITVGVNSATTGVYLSAASTGISVATTLTTVSDHNHSVNVSVSGTTSSSGSGASFSILPPYYALCYIQKVY
jgi:microcystin-dependent protein